MQLRWTREAAADLERIADYLFQQVPERAAELVRAVYDAPALRLEFPYRGRPGKKAGTRELVISALPYLVVYTVHGDVVFPARRPAMAVILVRSAQIDAE